MTNKKRFDLGPRGIVEGLCAPEFDAVAANFVNNFELHNELGASVCVKVAGQTVVDLWGGFCDAKMTLPWQQDTVSIVFSCTKAATALCAQLLVDRGQLDLNAPISRYWPEFAQAGKEKATVLMTLNHSVGLPALREPVKPGGYYDWAYMAERLANEAPFWEPGTMNGYHMISFGWLVGELVRRVSGRSLGTFFREEIAEPLGLDFWIGLPQEIETRVAPVIRFIPPKDAPQTEFLSALVADPKSIQYLSLLNNGGHQTDTRDAHAAEIGGGGGISNARSLARMFEPLANGGKFTVAAGKFGQASTEADEQIDPRANAKADRSLISAQRIEAMRQVSVQTERDQTLLIPTRFAQGFMLRMDNPSLPVGHSVRIGEQAFGHVGAGGSIGFADPQHGLSFGYSMNRMGGGLLLNERGQSLVDAAYACLR